jgi:heparan-alpha-glucosaminide N-acetyltransferase
LKRERPPWFKFAWLLVAGTISLALGWGLGEQGICPVVKRI